MSDNWLRKQVAEAKTTFEGWDKWKQDAFKAEVERSRQKTSTPAEGSGSEPSERKRSASASR